MSLEEIIKLCFLGKGLLFLVEIAVLIILIIVFGVISLWYWCSGRRETKRLIKESEKWRENNE